MSEDKRYYRIVACRIDETHPGAASLTHYAYATSVEEAATLVRKTHERPGGIYGVGLYRIVRVEEYPYGELAEVQPAAPADATATDTVIAEQAGPGFPEVAE